jgi:phosphoribosyl-ATP pyrophosphohydrolase/phosphoribosyl-AMP cyclohydrolase
MADAAKPASAGPATPDDIAFDARGLVPAVVQDARTGEVLMLAWQSREALAQTLASRYATFFSRSRNELWVKGATSGNTQEVLAISTDCDADAVLLIVDPAGPACHTGAQSCFFRALQPAAGAAGTGSASVAGNTEVATESVASRSQAAAQGATESVAGAPLQSPRASAQPANDSPGVQGEPPPGATLAALEATLRARRQSAPEGSYTAKLFADEALRHKKVGEEATELIVASLRGNKDEIAWEAADLVYHALVLLQAHGMGLAEVAAVLRSREGKRRESK